MEGEKKLQNCESRQKLTMAENYLH